MLHLHSGLNQVSIYSLYWLSVHWRLSILITSKKSVWSNVFWYVKVYIFWKCIQYTIHWAESQMLKKFLLDKINGTKNALFFLWRAPTHHSFTFNLLFLCELKHKVRLSKTVCGILHFWFHFVFIKVLTLWLQNVIIPFKIKIIERPRTVLLPNLWFLSCNKKF